MTTSPSDSQPVSGIAEMLEKNQKVDIVELDKSGHVQRRWVHHPDGRLTLIREGARRNNVFTRYILNWRKILSDSFLPVGFPHSVSDDYLAYQTYDSLQAFFSTITSLLANRALLQGLGVGDANSSATFAMLLTTVKDAMSRIATILFAHRFGLRIEPDCKRYRFLADVFNDTAFFLELYSPYLGPRGKVVALGAGEALRAMCGVAAGASKAALSVHFAKHDNLAELNAKEASQETLVGFVGLLVGTLVVTHIEDHTSVVLLMIVLVFAHLRMNYLAVCSVRMTTLNRQRATIVFHEYIETGKFLTPAEVAARENIVVWSSALKNGMGDRVATAEFAESYGHALGSGHGLRSQAYAIDGKGYTHFIPHGSPRGRALTPIRILLWNTPEPEPHAAIGAWFKAMRIANTMHPKGAFDTTSVSRFKELELDEDVPLLDQGLTRRGQWDSRWLCACLAENGWDVGTQSFETKAPVRLVAQPVREKEE